MYGFSAYRIVIAKIIDYSSVAYLLDLRIEQFFAFAIPKAALIIHVDNDNPACVARLRNNSFCSCVTLSSIFSRLEYSDIFLAISAISVIMLS